MNEIAAILLAAGRSRRMGAFKPLLPFGDATVVEACIENLRGAGIDEIVVVLGHRAGELRERLARLPSVRFAFNEEAESEMGVSIARGVEKISEEAEAVLLSLVDQPAVPPAEIRKLLDERRRTGARLVVPEWEGRGGHPVLVGLEFRRSLLKLDPQKGLRELFDAHRGEVLRVPAGSPYVARDMDTWDEYCVLHREIFGTSPPDAVRLRAKD
ncbi:MAG: nucleotidyltransferase family protein [Acidobacteria bacterium]|nr:nucleotidyltransferase family protein [Acidobacteriota bacterium]